MFKEEFTKLDPVKAARMIAHVNPHLDVVFDEKTAQAMVCDLPFYKGYFLVELSRHDEHPPLVRHAVCNQDGQVVPLDWTNAPLFALNENVPLTLREETRAAYVRFFFNYVRGSHGRFLIVDTVDDIDWREEPSPAGRKALTKMIEPLSLQSVEADGTAIFAMSVIFKDSLFSARAHLKPDGHVTLQDEELLVEDIPVADDLFGQ